MRDRFRGPESLSGIVASAEFFEEFLFVGTEAVLPLAGNFAQNPHGFLLLGLPDPVVLLVGSCFS